MKTLPPPSPPLCVWVRVGVCVCVCVVSFVCLFLNFFEFFYNSSKTIKRIFPLSFVFELMIVSIACGTVLKESGAVCFSCNNEKRCSPIIQSLFKLAVVEISE